jgi:hypothetical protein
MREQGTRTAVTEIHVSGPVSCYEASWERNFGDRQMTSRFSGGSSGPSANKVLSEPEAVAAGAYPPWPYVV